MTGWLVGSGGMLAAAIYIIVLLVKIGKVRNFLSDVEARNKKLDGLLDERYTAIDGLEKSFKRERKDNEYLIREIKKLEEDQLACRRPTVVRARLRRLLSGPKTRVSPDGKGP